MASEKANAEISDTSNGGGLQDDITDRSPHGNFSTRYQQFGKALAHRALYGSSSRRAGGRRLRTNDVKTLPSRLSKVSLADDDTEK